MVEVDEGVVRPQPAPQILARNHRPGPLEQRLQQLQRLDLQAHAGAVADELSRLEIEIRARRLSPSGRLAHGVP